MYVVIYMYDNQIFATEFTTYALALIEQIRIDQWLGAGTATIHQK